MVEGMMQASVQEQMQERLRADPWVLEVMDVDCVLTTPLKRTGDRDPDLLAFDATPQAFDPEPPYWVRRAVVIGPARPVASAATRTSAGSRYLIVRYPVAYYASPVDGETGLWQIRTAVMRSIEGLKVRYADGMGADVRSEGNLSAVVDIPELPGAGKMLLEQVTTYGVWRRA